MVVLELIGHEISHAFDDSGARFDGDGNVNNWWTEKDLKEFEKEETLADQYSKIEVLDDVFINGEFTLGENIGDLGGSLGHMMVYSYISKIQEDHLISMVLQLSKDFLYLGQRCGEL